MGKIDIEIRWNAWLQEYFQYACASFLAYIKYRGDSLQECLFRDASLQEYWSMEVTNCRNVEVLRWLTAGIFRYGGSMIEGASNNPNW